MGSVTKWSCCQFQFGIGITSRVLASRKRTFIFSSKHQNCSNKIVPQIPGTRHSPNTIPNSVLTEHSIPFFKRSSNPRSKSSSSLKNSIKRGLTESPKRLVLKKCSPDAPCGDMIEKCMVLRLRSP